MQLGDNPSAELVLSVGDWVYITPNKKDEPMEIGQITALWQDDKDGMGFDCKWAWRPQHISKGLPSDVHVREIFQTECEDGNTIGTLELCCRTHSTARAVLALNRGPCRAQASKAECD